MDLTTFLNISGVIGTVIGIVSIILYFKDRRIKEPCVSLITTNLIQDYISNFDNELQILYAGQKVKTITVTKLMFWNNGAETINRHDIATIEPVRIEVSKDAEILDIKVISSNNSANQFGCNISEDASFASIDFEYLDKGEGGIIQVVHTGRTYSDIHVAGIIKGTSIKVQSPYRPNNRIPFINIRTQQFISSLGISLLALLFAFISGAIIYFYIYNGFTFNTPISQPVSASTTKNDDPIILVIPYIFMILLPLTSLSLISAAFNNWRYPLPKDLYLE